VFVQAVEQPVEVGFGEAPVERHRPLLVTMLEGEQALLTSARSRKSLGVRTLRWITEK